MEKKTLVALLVVLVLGAGAGLLYWKQHNEEKSPKQPTRPVAALHVADMTSVEITQPASKEKVVLKKQGDQWVLTSPVQKPAEESVVTQATDALEQMSWDEIVSETPSQFANLDISDEKSVQVVVKGANDKVLVHLYLGKDVGASTFVRLAGQNQVWQVSRLSSSTFKKAPTEWRNHVLASFQPDDVETLKLYRAAVQVTVERQPAATKTPGAASDAVWKIKDSYPARSEWANLSDKTLDNALINRLLMTWGSLRAEGFADDKNPKEVGLLSYPPPRRGPPGGELVLPPYQKLIELTATLKGGKTVALRLGDKKGESVYVQVVGDPQIYLLPGWNAEALLHAPQDLGDKTVVAFQADDLQSVVVQRGPDKLVLTAVGNTWKVDGIPDADDANVRDVIGAFAKLEGQRFVDLNEPVLATLKTPDATVTLTPKQGTPVVLHISKPQGDQVAVARGTHWVWVPAHQVNAFLKKPADLKKSAPPLPSPVGLPAGMPTSIPTMPQ